MTNTSISRLRAYLLKLIFILSPLLYILMWNLIIRQDISFNFKLPFRIFSSTLAGGLFGGGADQAEVHLSASPEAILWRMGFIPMYWSKIGDLSTYHYLFSFGYLFYIGNLAFQMRRGKSLETLKKITSVNFDLIKRFWFAFGIIAFLTTSLSTVSILSDLLALIYYLAYIISLPMVPLSIYIWRKSTKRMEKQSDISENKEDS